VVFQYLEAGYKKEKDILFSEDFWDRTRGNGSKEKKGGGRFTLGVSRIFFYANSGEALAQRVDALFLKTPKVRLDRALST